MMLRLFISFCFLQVKKTINYRIMLFATFTNQIVKIYAMKMIWESLYNRNELVRGHYSLNELLVYSTFSIALSQCLTWWDGIHLYIISSVKKGTIVSDIFRPVSLPCQMLFRGGAEFIANMLFYSIPSVVLCYSFWRVEPVHTTNVLWAYFG